MIAARELLETKGVYVFEFFEDGALVNREVIRNVVTTGGKNLAFNSFLNGNNYTVVGPYMGLISGTSFSSVSAGDTMASHPGWIECGNANQPTYSPIRPLCPWAAAANGAISFAVPVSYSFTSFGTVQGAFITYGPGATSAVDSVGGVLWSAAAFISGAPYSVTPQTLLQVSYSVSM